jgi:hypothetical protein
MFNVAARPIANQNFALAGWRHEAQVGHHCPRCQRWLHTMRRPNHEIRQGNGTVKRVTLVALVCPGCGETYLMRDLGIQNAASIRRVVREGGADDSRPANTAGNPPRNGERASGAPVGAEASRRSRIVTYWRSVEMFTAQALDRPDRSDLWFQLKQDGPAPWEPEHDLHHPERWRPGLRNKLALREGRTWRHIVYGGVYPLEQLHRRLEAIFGNSGPDADERIPRGSSALFAITVSGKGRLQLDSLMLATAPWALGRANNPGPQRAEWLEGFGDVVDAYRRDINERLEDPTASTTSSIGREVPQSAVVGYGVIDMLVRRATEHLKVRGLLDPSEIRVHSEQVMERYQHDQAGVILNSLFLDDLQRVSADLRAGTCGAALAAYLRSPDEHAPLVRDRVDVIKTRDAALSDSLAPDLAPLGRWPAMAVHPLASSQQFAINEIVGRLRGGAGLFGVNGPPGTGKTTMLRDLLAAVVVARAEAMARFDDPQLAFATQVLAWRTGGNVTRYVHPVADTLTGHEIVVASANNEAVANVTREIPAVGAIGDEWSAEAHYLPDHATRLLGQPAWGLVAAVLGNAANRGAFLKRFWESDNPSGPGDSHAAPPAGDSVDVPRAGNGFRAWLDSCATTPPSIAAWQSAVARYFAACDAEHVLRRRRQEWHRALFVTIPAARVVVETALTELHRNGQQLDVAARECATATTNHANADAAKSMADGAVTAHDVLKPGWWSRIWSFGAATREWRETGQPLWQAAKVAAEAERRAGELQRKCAGDLAAAQSAHGVAELASATAEQALAAAIRELDGAGVCGETLPDERWRNDRDHSEIFGPWLDAEWNGARTRVFLAALELHEAFVAGAAAPIRANLDAAMAVLRGSAPQDALPQRLRTAWQTLFLVVPAVSTTFASVHRLFAGLGSEALGWLLIDEAGQATPQAAIGAICRARRVVAVGDPLQLEPIVGALHTTQAALRKHHRVDDFWLPDQLSVQGLADRVTPVGTMLPGPGNTDVWVGAPLRVHRRCDRPIFDLFNQPVYRGLMTFGKLSEVAPLSIRDSGWFDVPSTDADGNWIPAEGVVLDELLQWLLAEGVARSQILTISPFRRAASGVRDVLNRRGRDDERLVGGTVHTAQGKEAAVVILVLGGDPQRPGAAQWAASKPNLFNVAVSRARQRLFVIGDRNRWSTLSYFRELNNLPAVEVNHLTGP